ncbi:MAG: hypothetical protein AAGJ28_13975 [Pseudomonadota bacterium]
MRRLICMTLIMLAIASGAQADLSERQLGARSFLLFEPSGTSGRAPLLLALHGGFGSANQYRGALKIEDEARRRGFRIAYLQGTGSGLRGNFARTWHAGGCCGPARRKGMDDVGYITGVIDTLRKEGVAGSVHMIGHSNGGMMVYRYLCGGARSIASAVITAGAKMVGTCSPKMPSRALVIHGTDDPRVPFKGGKGSGLAGVVFTSYRQSVGALEAAGVQVKEVVLRGIGHKQRDISQALPAGLSATTAAFMFED